MRLSHCSVQEKTGTQLEGFVDRKDFWIEFNIAEPRTHVSTEGNYSSSSWYGAAVRPGWSEGVVILSTAKPDELGSIPHNEELLSSSC